MFTKQKLVIGNGFLITLMLLVGISYGQNAEKTRFFVQPTVPLEPSTQKTFLIEVENEQTDTLFQMLSKDGNPIAYYRKITTEVCFDDKCRLLRANIFWNITGRYLGVELPENEFLSKTDHEPFTLDEYNRLNHLLADSLLPLGTLRYEDLVPPSYSVSMFDAVTAATSKDVLEYVVQGAVYTTYTLWHIVYGGTQSEVMQLTEKALSPELLIMILDSPEVGDRYWALRRLNQNLLVKNKELRNKVIALIDENDYSLAQAAIDAFEKSSLDSDLIQNHLYSRFEESGYNIKKLILQKLSEAPRLSSQVKLSLAKQLVEFNGGLLVDVFSLFAKHQVNDKVTLSIISKLRKDDNSFKAAQASKYLKSFDKANPSTKNN